MLASPWTANHAANGAIARCWPSIDPATAISSRHEVTTPHADGLTTPSGGAPKSANATSNRPAENCAKSTEARPIASKRSTVLRA